MALPLRPGTQPHERSRLNAQREPVKGHLGQAGQAQTPFLEVLAFKRKSGSSLAAQAAALLWPRPVETPEGSAMARPGIAREHSHSARGPCWPSAFKLWPGPTSLLFFTIKGGLVSCALWSSHQMGGAVEREPEEPC